MVLISFIDLCSEISFLTASAEVVLKWKRSFKIYFMMLNFYFTSHCPHWSFPKWSNLTTNVAGYLKQIVYVSLLSIDTRIIWLVHWGLVTKCWKWWSYSSPKRMQALFLRKTNQPHLTQQSTGFDIHLSNKDWIMQLIEKNLTTHCPWEEPPLWKWQCEACQLFLPAVGLLPLVDPDF